MTFLRRCFLFVFLIAGLVYNNVFAAEYSDANNLLGELFRNYSTDIRPNQNLSETTWISLLS